MKGAIAINAAVVTSLLGNQKSVYELVKHRGEKSWSCPLLLEKKKPCDFYFLYQMASWLIIFSFHLCYSIWLVFEVSLLPAGLPAFFPPSLLSFHFFSPKIAFDSYLNWIFSSQKRWGYAVWFTVRLFRVLGRTWEVIWSNHSVARWRDRLRSSDFPKVPVSEGTRTSSPDFLVPTSKPNASKSVPKPTT